MYEIFFVNFWVSGNNFVSVLRTLIPKNLKKLQKLKTQKLFPKKHFSQPCFSSSRRLLQISDDPVCDVIEQFAHVRRFTFTIYIHIPDKISSELQRLKPRIRKLFPL